MFERVEHARGCDVIYYNVKVIYFFMCLEVSDFVGITIRCARVSNLVVQGVIWGGEVYCPAQIRNCWVVSGCINLLQCVGVC